MDVTCFFIGHREVPRSIKPKLLKAVEQHIVQYGVNRFLVGHYGLFDSMAADAVREAKGKYESITLEMLIPYHPADHPIRLPEGFDALYYPFSSESVPYRLAIPRANRIAVQEAQYLIAYANHPGNARDLLQYALIRQERGEIQVSNLAE